MEEYVREFKESEKLLTRVKKIIPAGTQTFSKGYKYYPVGASPLFMEKAKGCKTWDVDGNEYIDYVMGLGAVSLGYRYPAVDGVIEYQLRKGITFSQPSPLELELSESLLELFPYADMVRFSKTGSSVVEGAIRIAKARTGRNHVAFCGYHGWHEWFACTTNLPKGTNVMLPQYMHRFTYNDIDSLKMILETHTVAAVIMEPVTIELPKPGFLSDVENLTREHGALLIMDEMVTGFRFHLNGACEFFGIHPDIATFGKAMANGMPLGTVIGKKDVMEEFEECFFSTTYGGECLSLIASIATIHEMGDNNTIEHCWVMGKRLLVGLDLLGIKYKGYGCHPQLVLPDDSPEYKSLLQQELAQQGVLIHNGLLINFCYMHKEDDIDFTIEAFNRAMYAIKNGVTLKGNVVKPVFKRV